MDMNKYSFYKKRVLKSNFIKATWKDRIIAKKRWNAGHKIVRLREKSYPDFYIKAIEFLDKCGMK